MLSDEPLEQLFLYLRVLPALLALGVGVGVRSRGGRIDDLGHSGSVDALAPGHVHPVVDV